ncbi:MAG: hypothetical protein KGJ89_02025 [Patescibacteria group bacterium]|nr:hypothetical protein [Patescibacteria group bacterium]MDE2015654.1 hypothetical protein [Patescibacteria group bacterium]MDE2226711.1 hypothetical protein [Patescibacteria group bacterium]
MKDSDSEENLLLDRKSYREEVLMALKISNEYLNKVVHREGFWKAVADGDFSIKFKLSQENNLEYLEIRDREGNIWFFNNFASMAKIISAILAASR